MSIYGEQNESVQLTERVKAIHHAPHWLASLEKLSKTTMITQTHNCLLDYLNNGMCLVNRMYSLDSLCAI